MGRYHAPRPQRMDLLGHIRQERRNPREADDTGGGKPVGRQAASLLLARLPPSLTTGTAANTPPAADAAVKAALFAENRVVLSNAARACYNSCLTFRRKLHPRPCSFAERPFPVQKASITFLILGIICGVAGFGSISFLSFAFARTLFLVFLALFTVTGFIYVLNERGPME